MYIFSTFSDQDKPYQVLSQTLKKNKNKNNDQSENQWDNSFHFPENKHINPMDFLDLSQNTDQIMLTFQEPNDLRQANDNLEMIKRNCNNDLSHIPSFIDASYIYENHDTIHKTNCYHFATNRKLTFDKELSFHTLQPGEISGLQSLFSSEFSEKELVRRVLLDYPSAKWISRDDPEYQTQSTNQYCKGWKVFFYLSDLNQKHRDYHFIKQYIYGYIHKRGKNHIFLTDSNNHYIFDPEEADFDYIKHGGLNYGKPRGYFVFNI